MSRIYFYSNTTVEVLGVGLLSMIRFDRGAEGQSSGREGENRYLVSWCRLGCVRQISDTAVTYMRACVYDVRQGIVVS